MKLVEFKTKGYVEEKIWGHDDTYLVVSVQVPSHLFKARQNVTVTIAPRDDALEIQSSKDQEKQP